MGRFLDKDKSKVKIAIKMMIEDGEFGGLHPGSAKEILQKASGMIDLSPDLGKLKVSVKLNGYDGVRFLSYKFSLNHPALKSKVFTVEVLERDIFSGSSRDQAIEIVDQAENQIMEYIDKIASSINENSNDLVDILEKDILKGRYGKEFPALLIYAESEVQGLEIFVVLEKIVSGKGEWPEKNLEAVYSYTISGKDLNEEGKFVTNVEPDDTKEFMAKDIAEFLRYTLEKSGIF